MLSLMAENTPPALWLMIAAALGGGGTSAILPKVAPTWYRPDPATGMELRAVRHDFEEMRDDHAAILKEFLQEGPREVRSGQLQMINRLDRILENLKRCESIAHRHD